MVSLEKRRMRTKFTQAEDDFLRENIHDCYTLYDLTVKFNDAFPQHQTTDSNLRHHLTILGLRKGTHNIRKEKVHSRNDIGTIIASKDGKKARIKTEDGYVSANKYFLEKYIGKNGISYREYALVHLNGDLTDFTRDNIECVPRSIYSSMQWRGWFFSDPELTRTAILTATLLQYFPDLRHNEDQYLKK